MKRYFVCRHYLKWKGLLYLKGDLLPIQFNHHDKARSVYNSRIGVAEFSEEEIAQREEMQSIRAELEKTNRLQLKIIQSLKRTNESSELDDPNYCDCDDCDNACVWEDEEEIVKPLEVEGAESAASSATENSSEKGVSSAAKSAFALNTPGTPPNLAPAT